MVGFVFFDVETTGLRIGFDQIVHFAAVKTNENLDEVDRFEIRARLMPHVVPHPKALLTNGLTIAALIDPALPSHYKMVRAVRAKLFAWSPSIILGYNSMRFDDRMLQQAFFQTLQDPYLTAKHGNCRADALGIVHAAATLAPGCLSIPTNDEGRRTFKLDQVAPANGVAHDRAHDAMADVHATLHLCRRVQEHAPDVWNRAVRFSKKASTSAFVDGEDAFWLTEFFGTDGYHSLVTFVGVDPDQKNCRLCLNLETDLDHLASLSDAELQVALHAKGGPLRRVQVNAAPTIAPLFDLPDGLIKIDADEAEQRARRVRNDPGFMTRLMNAYVAGRPPKMISPNVETRLYEDFIPDDDGPRMDEFHRAPWDQRPAVVQGLDDERLRLLGQRLIYFERRSALSGEIRLEIERLISDRLLASNDEKGAGLSLHQALAETDGLLAEAPNDLLRDYRVYLLERIERVSSFRERHFPETHFNA